MKWIVLGALFLVTLLGACRHSTPGEEPAPLAQAVKPADMASRIYVEAVMLLISREELRTLSPQISELASRTDGSVVSAPHFLIETGRSTVVEAPADNPASFTWKLDGGVLEDGTIRLGVGVLRKRPNEEVTTTLVLGDGQVAILPTLFSAPGENVFVLVLQPETIHSDQDLEQILKEKRARSFPADGCGALCLDYGANQGAD